MDAQLTDVGRERLSPVFLRALELLKDDGLVSGNHQAMSETLEVRLRSAECGVREGTKWSDVLKLVTAMTTMTTMTACLLVL